MKSQKRKSPIPAGKVFIAWEWDAHRVRELDDLAASEGRTRDELIAVVLADYLTRRRSAFALPHQLD